MQIDFTNLFNSCDDVINVDTHFDFDDFEYSTYKPLKHGADVKGKAYCKADVAYLDLNVKFDFFGICDRCAEEFEKTFPLIFTKQLSREWKTKMMIMIIISFSKMLFLIWTI